MVQDRLSAILAEISVVLKKVSDEEVKTFIETILSSDKIVCVWAGRVWMTLKAFSMRLGHLGLNSWFLGDSTVPWIGPGDLLVVASGSWETRTILDLVEIAKKNGAKVALVTWNPDSSMGKLADVVVKVEAPSKTKAVRDFISIQPMTTLNEQSLFLFFDAVVLEMMAVTGDTHDTMWGRHSNLE